MPKSAERILPQAPVEVPEMPAKKALVIPIKTSRAFRKSNHQPQRRKNKKQLLNRYTNDKFFSRKLTEFKVAENQRQQKAET